MKKNFEKFQSDFYAEVKKSLPKFYNAVDTLQLIKDEDGRLAVVFDYTDVTGKRCDGKIRFSGTTSTPIENHICEINIELARFYPAWAEFDGSLECCIVTAMDVDNSENTYNVTIEPEEKGEPKLVYVTVHYDVPGDLMVTVSCPEADYIETFTAKATPEEIESAVRLDIFGE